MNKGGKFSDNKKGHGYERVIRGYPAIAAGVRRYFLYKRTSTAEFSGDRGVVGRL